MYATDTSQPNVPLIATLGTYSTNHPLTHPTLGDEPMKSNPQTRPPQILEASLSPALPGKQYVARRDTRNPDYAAAPALPG